MTDLSTAQHIENAVAKLRGLENRLHAQLAQVTAAAKGGEDIEGPMLGVNAVVGEISAVIEEICTADPESTQ